LRWRCPKRPPSGSRKNKGKNRTWPPEIRKITAASKNPNKTNLMGRLRYRRSGRTCEEVQVGVIPPGLSYPTRAEANRGSGLVRGAAP
jgi:hypothetical protein